MSDQAQFNRQAVGDALTYVMSRENAQGAGSVTLQSSLTDAIHRLDSDPGSTETYVPGQIEGTRRGKLQKNRDLRGLFFGTSTSTGLFDQMRAQRPSEYDL